MVQNQNLLSNTRISVSVKTFLLKLETVSEQKYPTKQPSFVTPILELLKEWFYSFHMVRDLQRCQFSARLLSLGSLKGFYHYGIPLSESQGKLTYAPCRVLAKF